jgi:L-alanine-DL-glutamate epimerase-like enolase superfamily enzyme
MDITQLETRRRGESPNLVWVRVHSDQGVVGLGATSYAAQRVESYRHEYVAPRVIGRIQELVTHVPQPVRGFFEKPARPGLGCEPLA